MPPPHVKITEETRTELGQHAAGICAPQETHKKSGLRHHVRHHAKRLYNATVRDANFAALWNVPTDLLQGLKQFRLSKSSFAWNLRTQSANNLLLPATGVIVFVDAVRGKNTSKIIGITLNTLAVRSLMWGIVKIAGERSVPIAGQILGGLSASIDTVAAFKHGQHGRTAASAAELVLYGMATACGTAAIFGAHNPAGWHTGPLAVVASGAAVAITTAKCLLDNTHIVMHWLKNRSSLKTPRVARSRGPQPLNLHFT